MLGQRRSTIWVRTGAENGLGQDRSGVWLRVGWEGEEQDSGQGRSGEGFRVGQDRSGEQFGLQSRVPAQLLTHNLGLVDPLRYIPLRSQLTDTWSEPVQSAHPATKCLKKHSDEIFVGFYLDPGLLASTPGTPGPPGESQGLVFTG